MVERTMDEFNLSCPLPLDHHATVQLAHGGGGRLMRTLIERMFLPAFRSDAKKPQVPHDSAVLELDGVRLAFTTDTFVVSPLFFPGGDIGKLRVRHGERPGHAGPSRFAQCRFILEEGLLMEMLS